MYSYSCLCIHTVVLVYVFLDAATLTGLSVLFPQLYGKSQCITSQTGHGPHSPKLLCCSMYCWFCVVLCIVCL